MEKRIPPGKRLRVYDWNCMGCMACANACPEGVITLTDVGAKRVLRFRHNCENLECGRCAEACPEGIIALGGTAEKIGERASVIFFDLARCEQCGTPFTSRRILDRLLSELFPLLKSKPEELSWLRLCPECRRRKQVEESIA